MYLSTARVLLAEVWNTFIYPTAILWLQYSINELSIITTVRN